MPNRKTIRKAHLLSIIIYSYDVGVVNACVQ